MLLESKVCANDLLFSLGPNSAVLQQREESVLRPWTPSFPWASLGARQRGPAPRPAQGPSQRQCSGQASCTPGNICPCLRASPRPCLLQPAPPRTSCPPFWVLGPSWLCSALCPRSGHSASPDSVASPALRVTTSEQTRRSDLRWEPSPGSSPVCPCVPPGPLAGSLPFCPGLLLLRVLPVSSLLFSCSFLLPVPPQGPHPAPRLPLSLPLPPPTIPS